MAGLRVVILGAGFAGLAAAAWLHRLLPAGEVEVIAVDRQREMIIRPLLVRAMVSPDVVTATRIDLARALRGMGASFVHSAAAQIDPQAGFVQLHDGERIPFDYAVIAMGHEPDWQAVPGLEPGLGGICDDFLARHTGQLNRSWQGGDYVFLAAPLVGTALHPLDHPIYESALIFEEYLRRQGRRDGARLTLVTARPALWSEAGSRVQRVVAQIFARRGIRVFTSAQPLQVRERTLEIDLPSGHARIPFDRMVAIPPYRGPAMAVQSGLADDSGWVEADNRQRHPRYSNVYVIGDASARRLPKTGHIAMVTARVAMLDLVARYRGRTPPPVPAPIVLSITELGGGRALFVRDNTIFGGKIEQVWTGRLPFLAKSAFMYTYRWLHGNLPLLP